jgi:hypothetical protein
LARDQFEIRETVKEIVVPVYVHVQTETAAAPKPPPEMKPLFAERSDDELLGYGVPAEWINDVRMATEDTLLVVADHLPAEAAEALLELATGGKPRVPQPPAASVTAFDHPDALRRFRVMANVEELQLALDFPLGEMDRLSASRPAGDGRARLHRCRARLRLSRYWQDNRRAAPG